MHRLLNAAASLGFLAALGAATLLYRDDLREREPARRHVAAFALQPRRPQVVSSVALALSPDWAAELVGDAALRDAFEGIDLLLYAGDLTPPVSNLLENFLLHLGGSVLISEINHVSIIYIETELLNVIFRKTNVFRPLLGALQEVRNVLVTAIK